MSFRAVCVATSLLCAGLSIGLLTMPDVFASVFGLTPSVEGAVMARRAGVLFIGLGGLIYSCRTLVDPNHTRAISRWMVILMVAMAVLGLVEFALSRVGIGIFVAILPEVIFAALFWRHARG